MIQPIYNTQVLDERHGRSPLYVSIALGNISLVLMLLQAGADPEIKDNDGRSAPRLACICDSPLSVAVTLLSSMHPHQVSASDDFGRSCLTYAAENGNTELLLLLFEKEAKRDVIPVWHWDLSQGPTRG